MGTKSSTSTIWMSKKALVYSSKSALGSTKTGSQAGPTGSLTFLHSPTISPTSPSFSQLQSCQLPTKSTSQLSLDHQAPVLLLSLLLQSPLSRCSSHSDLQQQHNQFLTSVYKLVINF